MLPWGHAAVGYLCYTLYTRIKRGGSPSGAAVVWLYDGAPGLRYLFRKTKELLG